MPVKTPLNAPKVERKLETAAAKSHIVWKERKQLRIAGAVRVLLIVNGQVMNSGNMTVYLLGETNYVAVISKIHQQQCSPGGSD